ncbi:hypothetical protein L7F22_037693 [Adiantum nelumboides]|nr:hypothetical protein [Adiantum nelumboides]
MCRKRWTQMMRTWKEQRAARRRWRLRSDEEEVEEEYEELEIDPEDEELMKRFEGGEAGERRGNKTLADIIMEKIDAAGSSGATKEEQGWRAAVAIQVWSAAKGIQDHSLAASLGKHSLHHRPSELDTACHACGDADLCVEPQGAPVTALLQARPSRQGARRDCRVGQGQLPDLRGHKKGRLQAGSILQGLPLSLCETGCTLKEAAIVSSVLTRVSIPILHSAAALLHLAEMHYAGPTSLFIRVLLDKKHALPYKVVDALVFHFLRFADPDMGVEKAEGGGRRMPVLWHQSLLVFCQEIQAGPDPDQKAALLDLLRVQRHDGIGPDVRRELTTGKARGEMLEEPLDEDDDMSI